MTSGQATYSRPSAPLYDWSNIATIRRSISRNRGSLGLNGDRYPKFGDPIRFSSSSSSSSSARDAPPPTRSGSTELAIHLNNGSALYPHSEERPTAHNLRSTKSEYFLASRARNKSPSVHSSSPTSRGGHFLGNADDDTKWITSSSSASYHSGNSSRDDGPEEIYAEICKPVLSSPRLSVSALPPLDRGPSPSPYRVPPSPRLNCGNYGASAAVAVDAAGSGACSVGGLISQQSTASEATSEQALQQLLRKARTPPPPSMLMSASSVAGATHVNPLGHGHAQQKQPQQPRKYFTLNPRTRFGQHQSQSQANYYHANGRHCEESRRRSMAAQEPIRETIDYCPSSSAYSSQSDVTTADLQLNRSQSCYGDPLDFKVGCQNTLRSKPLIPWYELAIKDSNRRSCPQFEVTDRCR